MFPKVGAWYADLDYVRLTDGEERSGYSMEEVYRRAAHAIVAQAREGEVGFKPWQWRGYYGETCAGVSYGSGSQGCILQVSGWKAGIAGQMEIPYKNVPRTDVQVTLWLEADCEDLAKRIAERSAKVSGTMKGGAWKVRLIEGYGDGDTTYLGSRSSNSFIRCYDKWREQGKRGPYRYAWRCEVETADEEARKVWQNAGASSSDANYWYAVVAEAMRRRGIYLPRLSPSSLEKDPPKPEEEDEIARRLAWYKNQVGPSLDKMRARGVSLGQLLDALGLSDACNGEVARSCASSAK